MSSDGPVEIHVVSDSTGETATRVVDGGRAPVPRPRVRGRAPPAGHERGRRPARGGAGARAARRRRLHARRPRAPRSDADALQALPAPLLRPARPSDRRRRACLGPPREGRAGRAAGARLRATSSASRRSSSRCRHDDGVAARAPATRPTSCSSASRAAPRRRSRSTSATSATRRRTCPLVRGIEPPEALFEIDPAKIVGVTLQAELLAEIRARRVRAHARPDAAPTPDLEEIYEELEQAEAVYRRLGCPVIEVSTLAIEETAHRIIRLVEQRGRRPGAARGAAHVTGAVSSAETPRRVVLVAALDVPAGGRPGLLLRRADARLDVVRRVALGLRAEGKQPARALTARATPGPACPGAPDGAAAIRQSTVASTLSAGGAGSASADRGRREPQARRGSGRRRRAKRAAPPATFTSPSLRRARRRRCSSRPVARRCCDRSAALGDEHRDRRERRLVVEVGELSASFLELELDLVEAILDGEGLRDRACASRKPSSCGSTASRWRVRAWRSTNSARRPPRLLARLDAVRVSSAMRHRLAVGLAGTRTTSEPLTSRLSGPWLASSS